MNKIKLTHEAIEKLSKIDYIFPNSFVNIRLITKTDRKTSRFSLHRILNSVTNSCSYHFLDKRYFFYIKDRQEAINALESAYYELLMSFLIAEIDRTYKTKNFERIKIDIQNRQIKFIIDESITNDEGEGGS